MSSFVERQLALLGAADPVAVLRATPERLRAVVARLGESGMRRSTAPGKWTGAQTAAHLADMETVFAYRLRQALAEEGHTFQPVEQDAWGRRYRSVESGLALEALGALRRWNVALVAALTAHDLGRPYTTRSEARRRSAG